MAIQVAVQKPIAQQPASSSDPTTVMLSVASHVNDADIVILNGSGLIASAPANVAGGIAGIAQHDSNANYGGATTTPNPGVPLGVSNVGTGLFPLAPAQTLVVALGSPIIVAINLTPSTGWISGGTQQAQIGTQVGLAIDAATGYYLADPTATNKVATITNIQDGVVLGGVPGGIGNLGARVYVAFIASALAFTQGH